MNTRNTHIKNQHDPDCKIIVSLRIRPFSKEELLFDRSQLFEIDQITKNKIIVKREVDKEKYQNSFIYKNILDVKNTQVETFEKTSKEVLDGIFLGYTGTIISYGQKGTGKTYTMLGEINGGIKKGIIPRSFEYIFDKIKTDKKSKYNLFLSYVQIYMEKVILCLNIPIQFHHLITIK